MNQSESCHDSPEMSDLRSSCYTRRSRGLKDLFHQKARSVKISKIKTGNLFHVFMWKLVIQSQKDNFYVVDSKLIFLH